ncbi:hypothetical protein [Streptomyces sp. NPDC051569]|uniref:hypothetical protein n=1 Tax=Streptomyces sp. NPDC051569 TaxID=3365661 RepID=UPI003791DF9E
MDTPSPIDDALELAAVSNRGATPVVAGGWAAEESLLAHPDDPKGDGERSGKAVAADRMAAIIGAVLSPQESGTAVWRGSSQARSAAFR